MTAGTSPIEHSALEALAVFPLPQMVLFPGATVPLHIFEPRYREMIRDVLASGRVLALAQLKPGYEGDYQGRPPLFPTCGVGRITYEEALAEGRYNVVVEGVSRVQLEEELPPREPYRRFRATELVDRKLGDPFAVAAYERQISSLWDKLGPHLPTPVRSLAQVYRGAEDPGARSFRLAQVLLTHAETRQRFLEELDPGERLSLLLEHLYDLTATLSVVSSSEAN